MIVFSIFIKIAIKDAKWGININKEVILQYITGNELSKKSYDKCGCCFKSARIDNAICSYHSICCTCKSAKNPCKLCQIFW